jgi:hypothetical protein
LVEAIAMNNHERIYERCDGLTRRRLWAAISAKVIDCNMIDRFRVRIRNVVKVRPWRRFS